MEALVGRASPERACPGPRFGTRGRLCLSIAGGQPSAPTAAACTLLVGVQEITCIRRPGQDPAPYETVSRMTVPVAHKLLSPFRVGRHVRPSPEESAAD